MIRPSLGILEYGRVWLVCNGCWECGNLCFSVDGHYSFLFVIINMMFLYMAGADMRGDQIRNKI